MSTILSALNSIAWWLLSHPTATLWIVACLLGIAAGLIGIKLIRKDVLVRMGLYKRQNGDYVFYSRIHRSVRYQVKFFGFGFTPRVVIRDGKQKAFRDPIKLKWVIPYEWEHNAYPHWEEPGQFERPFWTDDQDFVIGLREYRGRKSWAGGTKSLIGVIITLALVFAGVTMFSTRGSAEKVEIQSITPVVQGTQRVNEPRPTATAVPTRDEPVSVLVDTSKMPETNRDVWDWLNGHLPNLPAPKINIPVPDWFRILVGNSDGGAVISMQGLPGYVLILRDHDSSIIVRLSEELVPMSRILIEVKNFTITAGDYHWKLSWDNTHWKLPVKGNHGKIDIIINPNDEMTVNWKFSLLP